MAAPLDRTWYNTLVDDDGSGTTGTPWNKAAVNSLLTSVDVALASVVDKAGTPGVLSELPVFADADTIKGGSGIVTLGAGVLGLPTTPGADTGALYLTGAGSISPARGAHLYLAGNQYGAPGFISMGAGGGGAISFGLGNPSVPVMQLAGAGTGFLSLISGQILFPSTQKPSTDPNTFDDYREGTFLPTITGAGGGSGQTYTLQTGISLKFGRWRVVFFGVALSTLGTISGNVGIGNFPNTDQGEYLTQFCQVIWHNTTTAYVSMSGQIEPGVPNLLRLYGVTGASTTAIGTPLTQASLASSSTFYGTAVYRASN
jgi:hypothetical protein